MLQSAPAAPSPVICVTATNGGNFLNFAMPARDLNRLRSLARGANAELKTVGCQSPHSPQNTATLCSIVDDMDAYLKSALTDLYGFSPQEACDASREADRLAAEEA